MLVLQNFSMTFAYQEIQIAHQCIFHFFQVILYFLAFQSAFLCKFNGWFDVSADLLQNYISFLVAFLIHIMQAYVILDLGTV